MIEYYAYYLVLQNALYTNAPACFVQCTEIYYYFNDKNYYLYHDNGVTISKIYLSKKSHSSSYHLGMDDIDILASDYCKANISQLSR